jgi:hypothetical protein
MKEFITIAVAFFLVVSLALYMYISNHKSNIPTIQYEQLKEVIKDNEQLKLELKELKNQIHLTDSLYHKK